MCEFVERGKPAPKRGIVLVDDDVRGAALGNCIARFAGAKAIAFPVDYSMGSDQSVNINRWRRDVLDEFACTADGHQLVHIAPPSVRSL